MYLEICVGVCWCVFYVKGVVKETRFLLVCARGLDVAPPPHLALCGLPVKQGESPVDGCCGARACVRACVRVCVRLCMYIYIYMRARHARLKTETGKLYWEKSICAAMMLPPTRTRILDAGCDTGLGRL